MNNREKYENIFRESFQFQGELMDLKYQGIPEWDSVGHMQLMAALEDGFSVELDVDDIIDFSSYSKGMTIMAKYGVQL